MHSSRRRLLRWGLDFHVFTINKNAHTKKSGNLLNDPRTFYTSFFCFFFHIYIYIYIGISLFIHIWLNIIDIFYLQFFFVNPFELPYWFYDIRRELVDKSSIILDWSFAKKNNFIYQFKCPLVDCISKNNNIYVGLTSTTQSRRLTIHLSDRCPIAQYLKSIHAQQQNYGKFLPKTQY